jgi:hypothetical protein
MAGNTKRAGKIEHPAPFFNEAAFSGFLLRENVIVFVFFGIVIKIGE